MLRTRPKDEEMAWIEENIVWKEYLIYRSGWYRDPMTGIKEQCAKCVCTKCKETFYLERCFGGCTRYMPAPFGLFVGMDQVWAGATTNCPECGAEVVAAHVSNINQRICDCEWVMTADNYMGTAMLYGWILQREIEKDGREYRSVKPYEAYTHAGRKLIKYTAYRSLPFRGKKLTMEWDTKKRCTNSWGNSITIPPQKGIWDGTSAENAAIEDYVNAGGRDMVMYLWAWTRHKGLEALTRALPNWVVGAIEKKHDCSYHGGAPRLDIGKAKRPGEMLGLNREELRAFRDKDYRCIEVYREAKKHEKMKPEYISQIEKNVGGAEILKKTGRMMKALRYQKKTGGGEYLLRDYWKMAEDLGWEMTDEVLWPKDLKKAHDFAVEETNRNKVEIEKRKERLLSEKIAKRAKALSRTEYENDELMIYPVRSLEELREEGQKQGHCVYTYRNRIADGKTAILLIRRKKEPEKPYFTLEFDEKTLSVKQNRGKANRDRTPDVAEFEAEWLGFIRKKARKTA